MAHQTLDDIKKQARLLARENRRADPDIVDVYWLPDPAEVRLIEVEPTTVKCLSGAVEPYYFDASPGDGLPAPSGVALIRPEEVGELTLPEGWGTWQNAERLETDE